MYHAVSIAFMLTQQALGGLIHFSSARNCLSISYRAKQMPLVLLAVSSRLPTMTNLDDVLCGEDMLAKACQGVLCFKPIVRDTQSSYLALLVGVPAFELPVWHRQLGIRPA